MVGFLGLRGLDELEAVRVGEDLESEGYGLFVFQQEREGHGGSAKFADEGPVTQPYIELHRVLLPYHSTV